MAEPHVVTGLVAKRAEVSGLIDHHRKQIAVLEAGLAHLDATIHLFDPEIDLRTLRPKQHRQRNAFFRPRECQRLVLEIFRDADGAALGSRRIGQALAERKNFEISAAMIERLQKNAIGVVRRLERLGTLVSAGRDGLGEAWKLA
jgi:hypothetical protein